MEDTESFLADVSPPGYEGMTLSPFLLTTPPPGYEGMTVSPFLLTSLLLVMKGGHLVLSC